MSELLRRMWNNDQQLLNKVEELLYRLGCGPGNRGLTSADESMTDYQIAQVVFACKHEDGVGICVRHLDDLTPCPLKISLGELRRYIPPTQGRSY